ncbi:hypothetical protein A176_004171 [Myxococcus hansupus]|uniref:Uncharacterized protein n=1 Tax=Pseudomyxococcus hansupus TaxID=1297742 RepID=A0A0H4WWR7_9BACT|nr:hypothetical protein A176_004171 [Myxococcus hansupus]
MRGALLTACACVAAWWRAEASAGRRGLATVDQSPGARSETGLPSRHHMQTNGGQGVQ